MIASNCLYADLKSVRFREIQGTNMGGWSRKNLCYSNINSFFISVQKANFVALFQWPQAMGMLCCAGKKIRLLASALLKGLQSEGAYV